MVLRPFNKNQGRSLPYQGFYSCSHICVRFDHAVTSLQYLTINKFEPVSKRMNKYSFETNTSSRKYDCCCTIFSKRKKEKQNKPTTSKYVIKYVFYLNTKHSNSNTSKVVTSLKRSSISVFSFLY